jgi:maltose alpha-D-glucosyltransferase/alpha-amylase
VQKRERAKTSENLGAVLDEWEAKARKAFLEAYAHSSAGSGLYESFDDVAGLLALAELEKVLYELRYEMANRPDWIDIPLQGLAGLLGER